jgi:surface-anchored protein
MRIRLGNPIGLAGAAALAAVAGLLASAPARADSFSNIFTSGHADIGVGLEDDELFLHYHFEGATVNGSVVNDEEFEPGDVTTVVAESLRTTLGPGQSLPFLGLSAGDQVSILPQVNTPGVPFLGLATEELLDSDWTTPITFALVAVSGPGEMAVWQSGLFGATVLFNTYDGIDGNDAFNFPIGVHDHANYGFTEVGLYDVTIRVTGTHTSLGVLSDTATFRFRVEPVPAAVIPEPSSIAMLGLGAFGVTGGVALRRARSIRGRKTA